MAPPWWWCLWVSCVGDRWYFPYYSYRRNPTGREFFVPARTQIVVKLLTIVPIPRCILQTSCAHIIFAAEEWFWWVDLSGRGGNSDGLWGTINFKWCHMFPPIIHTTHFAYPLFLSNEDNHGVGQVEWLWLSNNIETRWNEYDCFTGQHSLATVRAEIVWGAASDTGHYIW